MEIVSCSTTVITAILVTSESHVTMEALVSIPTGNNFTLGIEVRLTYTSTDVTKLTQVAKSAQRVRVIVILMEIASSMPLVITANWAMSERNAILVAIVFDGRASSSSNGKPALRA